MFFMLVYFNTSCTELQGVIKLSILLSQTAVSPHLFHKQIKFPLNVVQSCLGTSLVWKLETFFLRSIVPILFFFPPRWFFWFEKYFFLMALQSPKLFIKNKHMPSQTLFGKVNMIKKKKLRFNSIAILGLSFMNLYR